MELIERLTQKLQEGLPGPDAQLKMAPPQRKLQLEAPENVLLGGVMVLLLPGEKEWDTLLIRRTEDGRTHSGQISFPGGKHDAADRTIQHTALRECEEEVGIARDTISVIGTMTPLYIPPSNFLVTPTLGYLNHRPLLRPSEREVQEIIQLPLSVIFHPVKKATRTISRSGPENVTFDTPVYELAEDLVIWGATAMILSELEHLLQDIS